MTSSEEPWSYAEDNVVYIFEDQDVDEEVVLATQHESKGDVYIVNGEEIVVVNEVQESEGEDSEKDEVDSISSTAINLSGVGRVTSKEKTGAQHIKRKRDIVLPTSSSASGLQVVRTREVQLFSREDLVQPQFCPDFHSEEVVLADSQVKYRAKRKAKVKKLKTEKKAVNLPLIKPKVEDSITNSSNSAVTVDEKTYPGRILVAFPPPSLPVLSPKIPSESPTKLPISQSIRPVVKPKRTGTQGSVIQIINSPNSKQTTIIDMSNIKSGTDIKDRLSRIIPQLNNSSNNTVHMKWTSGKDKQKCNYPKIKQYPVDKHRWLWQFMKELFSRKDPCLRWEDERIGRFYLEDINRLGVLWGNYKQIKQISRAQSWRQLRYYFGICDENRIIRQINSESGEEKDLFQFENLFYKERFIPYMFQPIENFDELEKDLPEEETGALLRRCNSLSDPLFCEKGCGSQFRKKVALIRHQDVCTYTADGP